jgi:AcrR family transcriptional regulator
MPAASEETATPRRRQRLSADLRREQIVRATTRVIATSGYANASLTAIAETADVAKGLLWHYFDDRDDLMRQALAHLAGQLREALVADLDLTAPVPEVIHAVFSRAASFTRTHGAELETIDQIVHNLRTSDGRQRLTMLDYEDTYADHEALLKRGQSEGSIRPGNLRMMAVGYQGMIDAIIGYLQAHPDIDPHSQAEQLADLFLAGAATARGPREPRRG